MRVVVVGGGLGGLAAAARLGRQGHEVLVLERAARTGGRLDPDGVTTPSTLLVPAVYRDLFTKTGRRLDTALELLPTDPARRYLLPGGAVLDLPTANRAATLEAFGAALGPACARAWDAMVTEGGDRWAALRAQVVAGLEPGPAPPRFLDRLVRGPWRGRRPPGGLRALGLALLPDLRARLVLEHHAVDAGVDPARAPAALVVLPYLEHAFGTWTVQGGLLALADAVAARARLRRAELRTCAEVTGVVDEGGRARGVVLRDGSTLPADAVVDAAGLTTVDDVVRVTSTLVVGLRAELDDTVPVEVVLLPDDGTPAVTLRRLDPVGDPTLLQLRVHLPAPGTSSARPGGQLVDDDVAALVAAALRGLGARGLDLGQPTLGRPVQVGGLSPARATGRASARARAPGPAALRLVLAPDRPGLAGLHRLGSGLAGAASLPFLGLSAALVAERCGTVARTPAPRPRRGRPAAGDEGGRPGDGR